MAGNVYYEESKEIIVCVYVIEVEAMKKLKIQFSILSMGLLSMSFLVITNAFGAIIKAFPKEDIAKIQMIATVPSLGTIFATICVGLLAVKFSKKILSLIGLIILTISGLFPLLDHSSVNILLLCALGLGIGVGFINTLIPTLISIYFTDNSRHEMMGKNTAMNSIGSIVMMLIGGILGERQWFNSYWIYLIRVVIFVIVLFLLPKDRVSNLKELITEVLEVF